MILSLFRVPVLLLPFLALLACGGPENAVVPSAAEAASRAVPGAASGLDLLDFSGSAATPWPTFTPFPTPTAAPVATPTRAPAPTPTAWPRSSLDQGIGKPVAGADVKTPGPSPLPGGSEIELNNVFLEKQALLPFRGGELPDYLLERDWDRMPPWAPVTSSDSRYMLWVVAFDFTQAAPGYEVQGLVRWRSVPPGAPPMVMFEAPVTVSVRSPFFYHGLGQDDPGLWLPGFYQVEFLDSLGGVAAHTKFEVRR